MNIENRSTDSHKIHWKHYFMHGTTAILVFCCGVLADVYIAELIRRQPKSVRWTNGECQTNYITVKQGLPISGDKLEVGSCDDGTIVYRIVK